MASCDRGLQSWLAVAGAFAAFSLMTVAIGTDYWLYSRAHVCNGTNVTAADDLQHRHHHAQSGTVKGDLTHSGLWRICCLEVFNPDTLLRTPPPVLPLTPSYPSPHPTPHLPLTLTPSYPSPHPTPHPVLPLTSPSPSPCPTPHPILPITPSYPSPRPTPHPVLPLTPSYPSPCPPPHPTLTLSHPSPLLLTVLLLVGGICVGVGQVYSSRNNILLSAGILFVAAGLSNIIGIIVYISSNAGDPSDKKDEERKSHYSYGWSFYSGALSFIVAELVGVLAIHIYIEKNKDSRLRPSRPLSSSRSRGRDFIRATGTASTSSPYARIPSYRYCRRHSHSSSSNPSREPSPTGRKAKAAVVVGEGGASGGGGGGLGMGLGMGLPMGDISMYTLSSRDSTMKGMAGHLGPYSPERDCGGFLQVHNYFQKDETVGHNRRTTPV
ncbi:hypothetical protein NHX12_018207 [Muraenolepis orangiensis]|uniref:Voltage-dependent calcium channel gamma-4 subunit n=1 Tax=Muraenolepis orangiensis TaxID=630683 RepID=A0A9Q0IYP0_9TELE|nr:hypothetical protein NHX12_018207 [Muraenolepis orangiensis]